MRRVNSSGRILLDTIYFGDFGIFIVDLEEKKKEAPDNVVKSRKLNQAITSSTSKDNILTKQSINDIFDEDFEEPRTDQSIYTESEINYDLYMED
ncbi:hypothetical protein HAX54_040326 [Datura stramonium]|uniref:Uncharacterized protein n=1 Tax=Datura stramonium TaxID=4076 RepID=A0ABS8SJY0_DATST|nr:hypothetical protein [Datura stramonium]